MEEIDFIDYFLDLIDQFNDQFNAAGSVKGNIGC